VAQQTSWIRAVGVSDRFDVVVVGGGIVGLATARALLDEHPGLRLAILEKEARIATHQTGHNSGVIHSGIYYKPGSHKAKLCVEGARLMKRFCAEHGIRVDPIGKVIVATSETELPRLQALFERGTANGVEGLSLIDGRRLREIEPHAAALRAIHSPTTSIVDYGEVAQALARDLLTHGTVIRTGARVTAIERASEGFDLSTASGPIQARHLVNCAGLYSDVVARLAGARPGVRIIPFRGEYYMIRPERHELVRGLIYPVPDPEFPFLGVHFTRTVHGEVEAGPNAVLAFAREGYRFGRIHLRELAGTLSYRGFWSMTRRYWRIGSYEMYRSLSKAAFVEALRRLLPEIGPADITPGGAGVRAQAVAEDGSLVDDFRITRSPDAIHVLNAPSPAATASLAIGRHIAGLAAEAFALS
jgi:(S)-2-hydroxyglutarate dehydrogenase